MCFTGRGWVNVGSKGEKVEPDNLSVIGFFAL